LAIASVTQVLKDLLNNGIIDRDVSGATGVDVAVTCFPPDRVPTSGTEEKSQLNLFMYMVSQNQGWRNQNFPSMNANGDRITNPYLALDLHYLLSAYSPFELHQEILLGYAMQLLFENPVLPREAIRKSLTSPVGGFTGGTLPPNLRALSTSGLADQLEMIKIVPEVLNTEEISKLWTAFQTNYRPTTAYRVTVVLIESEKSVKSALPVKQRNLYVQPFKTPVISGIQSQLAPSQPVVANQKILKGNTLIIDGEQLDADIVHINIDDHVVLPNKANITDNRISFVLPANILAGIHEITVSHPALMGSPVAQHKGITSAPATFALCPVIVGAVSISGIVHSGGKLSAVLTLKVNPIANPAQTIFLLLNQYFPGGTGGATALSYSFKGELIEPSSPPVPVNDISVHISGVVPGKYLVRIQVDGAESPLHANAAGKYSWPNIDLV
ncbi:MAG: DUF4255 domain-containing protein, partial [Mucilaginibacter sp.]